MALKYCVGGGFGGAASVVCSSTRRGIVLVSGQGRAVGRALWHQGALIYGAPLVWLRSQAEAANHRAKIM